MSPKIGVGRCSSSSSARPFLPRLPAPPLLQRCEKKEFYYVTTTDDPVMEKLAVEGKGNVFATDAILAHLMASPRTIYPWDIVVQKVRVMLGLSSKPAFIKAAQPQAAKEKSKIR